MYRIRFNVDPDTDEIEEFLVRDDWDVFVQLAVMAVSEINDMFDGKSFETGKEGTRLLREMAQIIVEYNPHAACVPSLRRQWRRLAGLLNRYYGYEHSDSVYCQIDEIPEKPPTIDSNKEFIRMKAFLTKDVMKALQEG